MEFRDALKLFRSEMGLAQADIATALHINIATVGRWEQGKTAPNRSCGIALLTYAKNLSATKRCIDNLETALNNSSKQKLFNKKNGLYSVEHATISRLIENAAFPIYVCDLDTDEILYANQATEQQLGKSLDELAGKKCYEQIMHRDKPCEFCHKNELSEDRFCGFDASWPFNAKTCHVQGKIIQWRGHDAQVRYVLGPEISSEFVPTDTEETAAFHQTKADVANAGKGLLHGIADRDSARQLKNFFNSINSGVSVVVYDDNDAIRSAYANEHYYQMLGYTKEQFDKEQGAPHNTTHPDDRDYVTKCFLEAKQAKQASTFRYRVIKRDKSVAHFRCDLSFTTIDGINGYVLISIINDITKSVQSEQQTIVYGQRLDAIMKNMNSAVTATIVKSDGSIEFLFSNDLYHEMLGYTKAQYQAEIHDPCQYIHPDDLETVQKAVFSLHRVGDVRELQYRAITRDKKIKWLQARISMMTFPDAESAVQLAIYTDITEFVEAQEKLAAQREQIATLLNDTPSGIAIIELNPNDITGTLHAAFYNDRFFSYSGYDREEYRALLKNNELAFVFQEDMPALITAAKQLCDGEIGASANITVRCHTKGGGFRWLLLTGQQTARREDIYVLSIAIIDVTERQEAVERRTISEEMLRIAAETDQRAMVIFDIKNNTCRAESRMLYFAKFGETFENVPQSLIDMGLTTTESENDFRSLFARIRAGEKNVRVSLQLRSGAAKYEWFECNSSTVFDSSGAPDHAIMVFHNITEQRIKEAVFRKWQQSITARPIESYTLFRCNLNKDSSVDQQDGELLKISFPPTAATFNSRTKLYAEEFVFEDDREAYIKLLDSDSLLAMFYRGEHFTSIEYRETALNGELRWRSLTIEMVEYPNSTDVHAFLMYEDIDEKKRAEIEALELAKSDPLTGALNRSAFAEAVDELIRENPDANSALIMIDMDGFKQLNDTFGHAAGDQALQEVAAVLRSYAQNGDLVCRLGGDEFMVWLRDVPYDAVIGKTALQICEHIRKAYSQEVLLSASAGIAVYPRDGQGYDELYPNADKALYKVKQSKKGAYAFFSATDEEQTDEVVQALTKVKQLPDAVRGKKHRMLIVDDNETSREIAKNIFKDEFLIETAKNGAAAMIRLRHFGSSIAVVLLDLIMPGDDGFTVLKRMQSDVSLRTIPVIIVTGEENRETRLKAFELGAAEFVIKPIDVDVIRMRVQSAISKAENERLRAQNSYLMLQRDEESKYHTVLESTGTAVVEHDWRNHVFIYDQEISKHIAGSYDHRGLWQIFLSDMVADSADVKTLQDAMISLANNRESERDSKLIMLKTPQGDKHWFRINFYKIVDDFGLTEKLIITLNDVHEEILSGEKLLFQATRDKLTGLYNRTSFLEKAAEFIAAQTPGYYVMACIDVEKFQTVNDQYGTDKGDEVLKHIAVTVNDFAQRHGGLCCRYAADKYAVLYPATLINSDELAHVHHVASSPRCIPRLLRLRIGRCMVNDISLPVSTMFDRAALAEASAKGHYETNIINYDDSMRDSILQEQQIVSDMTDALKNGEFEPWFQPQYNHLTGALIGAEALVRWRKDGKIISPSDFIPIFEKNGFIYEVDQFVWRSVCALLRRWLDEGKDPLPISVNISRHDMFQDSFIDVITGLVAEYRLPAELLRLEITESAFSADTATITKIAGRLISAGLTVEIDDFGSGYSSLNTLKDVPASILKLDMRFFERTGDVKRGGNIVSAIVRMAGWLGMAVIAEGVEDKAQADYLKSIGCYYIQGFLYAKPMTEKEYEKQLISEKKEPQLVHMTTLQNLDNNDFWDPHSMDTLIFNSYVGAASIIEIDNGRAEMLRATDHFVRMLGDGTLNISDVLAIDWTAHMDERDTRLFRDAVAKSLETRESVTEEYELRGLPKCPKIVILRITLRVIATAGERKLIYCLNENITAQRAAEQEALHASERISAVMDNSHCGISAVIARPDGTVELLFVNNRFYELLGYTPEQYAAEVKSPYDRIVPEDRDKVFKAVTKLTTIGSTVSMEVRETRRDGSIAWLRSDISIVKFANIPEPVQIASFLDITQQKENELKQLESARQLEVIMSNVNGGVSALRVFDDATSKFVFNNDKYYELYGYTKEEALAENLDIMTLILPEDLPTVMEAIKQMKADRQPRIIDYRITKKDGRYALLRANSSLMKMTDYDDDIITSVVTDITEQKSVQETLGAIVANINGGISAVYLHEDKPEYVIANEQYYQLIGYTKEEFEAEDVNPFDLIHPDDRAQVEQMFAKAREFGERYTMEYRIVLRDGAVRHVLCNTNVVHLFGIDVPVQLAVSNDITEIREMQRKELALSTQLQTIMQNIHGGITATLYHDENNIEIVFSNDGFYEMHGYTRAQMEAEVPNIFDLIFAEDLERIKETIARTIREGKSETCEYRCHKRGGGVVWIQCNNSVFSLDGVGDTVLLAVTTDITALRIAQQEQLEVTDRLRTVMNAMPNGMTAVVIHGDRMDFLFANTRYYEMHGVSHGDISETQLSGAINLIIPEYRDRIRNTVRNVAKSGQTAVEEYQIRCPDKSIRWVRAIISMTTLVGIDDPVQVTTFTDVTAEKESTNQLHFLNDIANDILAQSDSEQAIKDTLTKLVTYFSAARGYIIELDESRLVLSNTYEICADGVEPEIENWRELDYSTDNFWYEQLSRNEFFIIDDVSAMDDSQAELRETLLSQDIRSIILAPLWRDGRLIAFAGVDNPLHTFHKLEQLRTLSEYCTVLLTRRDLIRKITHDSETMQQLMADMPGGFARMELFENKNPTIIIANDGLCKMLNMTKDELVEVYGDNAFAGLSEDDAATAADEITEAYVSGGQYTTTCRLRKKDGSMFWVMLFGRFAHAENGRLFLNAYFTDITEKLAAEENQKTLLDNLPFGAAMYDFDGQRLAVIHINRQYWKLVNREPTEYDKTSVTEAIHPEDRAVTMREIQSAIAQGRDASADIRISNDKGGYLPFHVTASIVPQSNGNYQLFVAYARISEQELTFENALPHIFSTIMESSTDLTFTKDVNYRYICCSKTFATLLGLKSADEVVGKTDYELFPKDIADMFRRDDSSLFATQKPQIDIQEMIPSPDGIKHYIRTSKYLLRNDSGTVIGIYSIGRDITEVREAYAQLRLLTDSIPGGIATFRCSPGNIETIYFNDGVCELAGYSREEYDAHPVKMLDLIFDEDRPIIRKQIELMQNGEKRLNFTVRIHTKDGGYKWTNDVATVTESIGEVYIVNAVLTDVTEQQEEKERLRLAEEEYRIATSHSGHTIGRYDIATRTLTISEDASVKLALPELISDVPYGRVKLGKISKATADDYIAFYEKIMHGEKECSVTFQKLLSTGWRWITERATTIFDDNGSPVSAIISYSDVTDQQEKEAVYKKWQQNLSQKGPESYTLYRCNLNRDSGYDSVEGELLNIHEGWNKAGAKTFNERTYDFAACCVVKEDRALYLRFVNSDTMLASYYRGKRADSIEFRGIVATGETRWIRLSVELVEYPNTNDVAAYLMYEDINDSKLVALQTQTMAETDPLTGILNRKTFIDRMDGMLAARKGNALYALLLLDMDGFKLINDSFGHAVGDQVLIDTARAIRAVLRESDLVCRMGGDEFLICMSGLPNKNVIMKKARQILDLVHNVVKLEVKLSVSAGIAVCPDDGNTFELLYPKVDKALYHVKSHGKDNCVFYDASLKTALISTDDHVLTPIDPSGKPLILIVSGNKANCKVLSDVFSGDCKVETAEDGASALNYLRHNTKDLTAVLLETDLPDMDGFAVLKHLQELELTADIPVVVISSMDESAALRVIKAGASDFVTTPINPTLLKIRVESAIAKTENERLRAQNRFLALLKKRDSQ